MIGAMVWVSLASAQELRLPSASPAAEVMQRVGVVDVTVRYSSPGVKGRTVWGELVPYDQLWRTGANAATTLEVSGDVTVGGTKVPAGTYSVLTIPGQAEWTVILNKDTDVTTDDYQQGEDVLRVKAKAEEAPVRERLVFLFSDTTDDATRLDLEWAGKRVSVPITADTNAMVMASIGSAVESAGGTLARAARYKREHGDAAGAVKLLDASLAIEQSWYNTWLKADALHELGENKAAYKLALQANELGKAAGDDYFWKDRVEKALAEWPKK